MKVKIIIATLLLSTSLQIGMGQTDEVNSPIKNFEALWKAFDQRYANFELKNVDWDEVYKKYRPSVSETTTNLELFQIGCQMLHELKDGHVTIEPDFEESDIECGAPYPFQLEEEFNTQKKLVGLKSLIDNELKKNRFSEPKGNKVTEETNFQYRTSETLGYLRLDEMTEKVTFGKFKAALNIAMRAFQDKNGLIIDLRFNGGGSDHIAYKLASRLLAKGESIGHYERTRIKGKDEFTPMKYKKIESRGKNQFTNPIVILTSNYTASAAEVFVLLMNEVPYVTVIGDRTEGIFSDMYEFKLPNKWSVSLSHQQFFSENKENFEGRGISPDIKVLTRYDDVKNQIDPVIKAAVDYLKKKN